MESKPAPTMKMMIAVLFLTVCFCASPGIAAAHKVSIFAWVEGDTVYTVSKFSGGKKVKHGHVTVFGPEGNQLLEGLTDDQGEFAFKIPQKTGLRVELVAGAGHKGYWDIPAEDITGNSAPADAGTSKDALSGNPIEATPVSDNANADLEAALERVLDKKLKPVMKILTESKQAGPSLTEILGGIGYIIGLVGIAAYFKSRKKE